MPGRPGAGERGADRGQVSVTQTHVKPDCKSCRPNPIGNRLTRAQRRQGMLHGIRSRIAASVLFGFVDGEPVSRARFGRDLARNNQVVMRLELGLRLCRVG